MYVGGTDFVLKLDVNNGRIKEVGQTPPTAFQPLFFSPEQLSGWFR